MATSIGEVLQIWADYGIFYYALPFMLIFALVFAILQKLKLTGRDNRGIDAVIALSVALMSLLYDKVPLFFQSLMPNVGIGLAVILAALILVGLFVNPQEHTFAVWIFFALGGIVFIVILLNTFEDYSWWTGGFWQENMEMIIAGIILIIFIVVVITSGKTTKGKPFRSITKDNE